MNNIRPCRSCGKDVEWCRTPDGKPIPMDVDAVANGNMVVIAGLARPRGEMDDRGERPRRQAHFASCPQASLWRKR